MDRIVFKGIMPALISPVNEDGSIREKVLRPLVDHLSGTGITGFYLCGGTGEGIAMEPCRRMELVEIVKDQAPKEMKLINHLAAGDLATAVKLARHSREIGLDGIASVPPIFYRYDQHEIYDYYAALSDASQGLPLLIYASPLAGTSIPLSAVEKMLDIPGFVGLKYTNPDYFFMRELKKIDGGNINVINGPDETCLLGLLMGADGAIGSTYNNMPGTFVGIYNAFMAGDYEKARQLQFKACDLIAIYLRYQVIAGVKAALELQGFDVGEPNRPLPRLNASAKKAFQDELVAQGFPEEFR